MADDHEILVQRIGDVGQLVGVVVGCQAAFRLFDLAARPDDFGHGQPGGHGAGLARMKDTGDLNAAARQKNRQASYVLQALFAERTFGVFLGRHGRAMLHEIKLHFRVIPP